MYRVLFVTDQPANRKSLKSGLLEQGCAITFVASGKLFAEDMTPPKTDVVVVDLERTHADAQRLCHALRRDPTLKDLPLVLLVPEEQLGQVDFRAGVDDYLTLPISVTRLMERIKFLLWKLNKAQIRNGFKHGDLAVDFERYDVHVHGVPVDLTYKEFELLKFLAQHPGKVFSREALLDKVWGYDYYGGTRTVDVHIRRLRSKVERGGAVYIETVRNVGYRFIGT